MKEKIKDIMVFINYYILTSIKALLNKELMISLIFIISLYLFFRQGFSFFIIISIIFLALYFHKRYQSGEHKHWERERIYKRIGFKKEKGRYTPLKKQNTNDSNGVGGDK